MIKSCLNCNKQYDAHRKTQKFCGYICGSVGRSGRTQTNQRAIVCKNCGDSVSVKHSRVKTRRFCSKKCYSVFQRTSQEGEKNSNYKDGKSLIKNGNSGRGRNYRKGRYYETKTRKKLEEDGYSVVRSAGSKGPADIVAINNSEIRLIQVKAGKSRFSLEERLVFEKLPVPNNCSKELWSWVEGKAAVIEILADVKN